MWSQMSDETQKYYTEDYFEFKVRSLPEYINAEKVRKISFSLSLNQNLLIVKKIFFSNRL